MKFTLRNIEALVCPPGRKDQMHFDPSTQGFGVRVSAAGGKVFLAQTTVAGVKRRVPLGAFGVLTIEQARAEALKVLRAAAAGTDLVAERKALAARVAAAKRADAFTFNHLVEAWVEAREGERRESYLREARSCLLRNLPGWLARPASSITTAEAIEELDRIKRSKSTVAANRTLAYARAAFGWAVKRQRLASNPMRGIEQLRDLNAQYMAGNLKPDDLAPAQGPDFLPQDYKNGVMLDAAKRGAWVPNADESGLVLMATIRNGGVIPVRGKDGSPITIRFQDVAAGKYPPPPTPPPQGSPFLHAGQY